MHHDQIIKHNAIFISDAHHHGIYKNTLDEFFKELISKDKRQIFLMGDIFDFLIWNIEQCITENKKTLELLEEISKIHEVYYFEGNHDFLLDELPYFKSIKYFKLSEQPVKFQIDNKSAYLAHGDIFLNWHYTLYTKIIRSKTIINLLRIFQNKIYKKIIKYLQNKNENYNKIDLDTFINKRVKKYIKKINIPDDSYIIEGHFHLGIKKNINNINYIGLPLFYCKKKYFVVEYSENYCLSFKQEGRVK